METEFSLSQITKNHQLPDTSPCWCIQLFQNRGDVKTRNLLINSTNIKFVGNKEVGKVKNLVERKKTWSVLMSDHLD